MKKIILAIAVSLVVSSCAPLIVGGLVGAGVATYYAHNRPGWCYYWKHHHKVYFRC